MQTLEWVCTIIGYPKSIRVDQGSEFISRDLVSGPISAMSFSTSRGPARRRTSARKLIER